MRHARGARQHDRPAGTTVTVNTAFPPVYLFLDFDGVLHPRASSETGCFLHADRLRSLLDACPEVMVVVSSSWGKASSLAELRRSCGPLLGPRLHDVTPIVKLVLGNGRPALHRFKEIAYWLATHPKSIVDTRSSG